MFVPMLNFMDLGMLKSILKYGNYRRKTIVMEKYSFGALRGFEELVFLPKPHTCSKPAGQLPRTDGHDENIDLSIKKIERTYRRQTDSF